MESAGEPDCPALDYVMRYPPDAEDDPDDPAYAEVAAAAALMGPDLHGPLQPEPQPAGAGAGARGQRGGSDGGGGWRVGAQSLIAQLRQRALSGSSSDDEGQAGEREWQSMDIPALLLSPHHAAALHSLSSSEDDTSAVPDFADQALAREADRAAQAAAELVPPELRPLVRAANLLGFHQGLQGQGRRPAGAGAGAGAGAWGSGGSGSSPAGEDPEAALHPLEANRFTGLCEPLTDEQLETVAMLVTAASGDVVAAAGGDCCGSTDPEGAEGVEPTVPPPAEARAAGAAAKLTAAAAAAALAEEGLEWLDAARPAAAPEAPPPLLEGGDAGMDEEERSVQLRRRPCKTAAEAGMDAATRRRVAEEAAHELAEAEAHVVHYHHAGGGAADTDAGSAALKHGSAGRFVELKGTAAAVVEGVAAAGGRAAADEAAEAVATEARRAVWGEAGWPYGAAMRTTDLSEQLKHAIQQQQEEAEQGAPGTLLP